MYRKSARIGSNKGGIMKLIIGAVVSLLISGYACAQPNIAVIMVDDLDVGSDAVLSAKGWTPNLDALRDAAVVFDNMFVTDPICCPSRATFLTGQYPHNHGVLTNYGPKGGADKLDEASTIAVALQPTYRTIYIGKYLNAYGVETTDEHVPLGWDDWYGLVDNTTYKVYDFSVNHNGGLQTYGSDPADYQTDVLRDLTLTAIAGSEPFFLVISTLAPHVENSSPTVYDIRNQSQRTIRPAPRHVGIAANEPLPMPPNFNEEDVSDKPAYIQNKSRLMNDDIDCMTRIYRDKLESMMAVDDLVGSVVAALPPDTIIFYVSDNGFLFGEHRLWRKGYPHENSIRVPMFVVGPWASRSTGAFVTMNDLAPTIAEIADVQFDNDGMSLIPLLEQEQPWRQRFLIENLEPLRYSAMREADLLFAWYPGDETERYFLDVDPSELDSDPPAGAEEEQLIQQLQRLKLCADQTCRDEEFFQ